jgi:hypothetical protein
MRYKRVALVICLGIAGTTIWETHGAFAGEAWTCKLMERTISCSSSSQHAAQKSPILEKKMTRALELLNGVRCSTTTFDSSGETVSKEPLMIASVEIYEGYTCAIVDKDTTERRRVAETGNNRYFLDCEKALFKHYAIGFDTYMDGSTMHWDSLTERVPWKPISDQPTNRALQRLFGVLCR